MERITSFIRKNPNPQRTLISHTTTSNTPIPLSNQQVRSYPRNLQMITTEDIINLNKNYWESTASFDKHSQESRSYSQQFNQLTGLDLKPFVWEGRHLQAKFEEAWQNYNNNLHFLNVQIFPALTLRNQQMSLISVRQATIPVQQNSDTSITKSPVNRQQDGKFTYYKKIFNAFLDSARLVGITNVIIADSFIDLILNPNSEQNNDSDEEAFILIFNALANVYSERIRNNTLEPKVYFFDPKSRVWHLFENSSMIPEQESVIHIKDQTKFEFINRTAETSMNLAPIDSAKGIDVTKIIAIPPCIADNISATPMINDPAITNINDETLSLSTKFQDLDLAIDSLQKMFPQSTKEIHLFLDRKIQESYLTTKIANANISTQEQKIHFIKSQMLKNSSTALKNEIALNERDPVKAFETYCRANNVINFRHEQSSSYSSSATFEKSKSVTFNPQILQLENAKQNITVALKYAALDDIEINQSIASPQVNRNSLNPAPATYNKHLILQHLNKSNTFNQNDCARASQASITIIENLIKAKRFDKQTATVALTLNEVQQLYTALIKSFVWRKVDSTDAAKELLFHLNLIFSDQQQVTAIAFRVANNLCKVYPQLKDKLTIKLNWVLYGILPSSSADISLSDNNNLTNDTRTIRTPKFQLTMLLYMLVKINDYIRDPASQTSDGKMNFDELSL